MLFFQADNSGCEYFSISSNLCSIIAGDRIGSKGGGECISTSIISLALMRSMLGEMRTMIMSAIRNTYMVQFTRRGASHSGISG